MANNPYNDLGFKVGSRLMILVEAQSTWTENIIVRCIMYLAQTWKDYFISSKQSVYASTKLEFPEPELYVLYTGSKTISKTEISLSEEFFAGKPIAIDAKVKVLITGKNNDIITQYVLFTKVIDEQRNLYKNNTQTAITETIRICKDKNILKEYSKGGADILIGTQMIVKGHDFANVTLVGILAADLSLNSGDYRAAEKTFQLTTQACGRAGRADKPGEVVIQTYQPEHYSIVYAAKNDYKNFYEQEIVTRQMLQYPPISNILGVLVLSENERNADNLAQILADKMKLYQDVTVLGPAPAALSKVKDVYRRMIYGKCADYGILCSIKNSFEEFMHETESFRDCRLNFEFNLI